MLSITEEDYLHPVQTDTSTVYTLEELRSLILPLAERRGMGSVRLFGSYARGEADAESDIDLIVDKGGNRFLAVSGLAEDILDATGKLADVFDQSELVPGPFRNAVLREAIAL